MIYQETGISKGTFYYHFSGKSDLIYTHIDSFMSDIDNKLQFLSHTQREAYMYHTNPYAKMTLNLVKKCQDMGSVTNKIPTQNLIIAFESAVIGTGLDWACTNGAYDEVERLRLIFDSIFR